MLNPSRRWRWVAIILGLAGLLATGCGASPATPASNPKAGPTSTPPKDGKPAKPPVERDPG
jgi:hypothetical protein